MTNSPQPSRSWFWLQLIIGWLPMWGLFTVLIMNVHSAPFAGAAKVALRMIVSGAVVGLGVSALVRRCPWPYPFRWSFLLIHTFAATLYSLLWAAAYSLVESLVRWHLVFDVGPGLGRFMVTGIWLYLMIAAVSYAQQATQRTALIQAATARAQLAALHAQLHPHFLFNALHTVVQLIPLDPAEASHAAEQLADLLRSALDERRDQIPLAEEWRFVERYLAIEQLRFGDRLLVTAALPANLMDASLPSFALQTLVENAVRHGAAPKVSATHLHIQASIEQGRLCLVISDDGAGAEPEALDQAGGTGLQRLRERLTALYGSNARLAIQASPTGVTAALHLPATLAARTTAHATGNDND
ncbi:sensor histidine kinase [Dyella amyloliquefaciens]|uniref:sensor histidine kinase n=1 Tax=Dyella amyloliquefaciens TaxID=1770545 RepID=UPI00102EC2C5|nr:histidine kinase [Dyella amyloliquefaciens]